MTEHKNLFKRKDKEMVKPRRRSLSPEMQTYDYKAPEVLLNQSEYDYAIDVWGAGCVLGELLTASATNSTDKSACKG